MQASEANLNGRFAALETQRNQAENMVVILSGQIADLSAEKDALIAEIASLRAKLKKKAPAELPA